MLALFCVPCAEIKKSPALLSVGLDLSGNRLGQPAGGCYNTNSTKKNSCQGLISKFFCVNLKKPRGLYKKYSRVYLPDIENLS